MFLGCYYTEIQKSIFNVSSIFNAISPQYITSLAILHQIIFQNNDVAYNSLYFSMLTLPLLFGLYLENADEKLALSNHHPCMVL